jgi:hypothetical protein
VTDEPDRGALLDQLAVLNDELNHLGVRPVITYRAASLYTDPDELAGLIESTRQHLLRVTANLRGTQ